MARLRSVIAIPLLVLSACSTLPASGPPLADGDRFRMQPGTSLPIDGEGTLQYRAVVNDSRCPPGVQCVWAGDAEVAFVWRPQGGAADAFSLHTGKGDKSHPIGNHVLVLAGLERGSAPAADLALEARTP